MRMIDQMVLAMLLSGAIAGCQRAKSSAVTDHGHALPAPGTSDTAAVEPAKAQAAAARRIVKLGQDITVHLDPAGDSLVEVKARSCLDEGFLEQVACSPGTREHESLVIVSARPSQIHAALLMAGFEPGAPGSWTYENNQIKTARPRGDRIQVLVRYADRSGNVVEHPIRQWIREAVFPDRDGNVAKARAFPNQPWIFGGSSFAPNTPRMGPGEHYVADMTGSIIGLVTFGDEVLGFSDVLSDQEDVQPQEWEVNSEVVPPMGTEVTLILKRWRE